MDTNNKLPQERRDFYRIVADIALHYAVMPANFQPPTDLSEVENDTVAHRLLKDLRHIDSDAQLILQNIRDKDIKNYFEVINEKIDLVSRYIAAEMSTQSMPFTNASISGGGIKFNSKTAIEVNRILKIELLLYPACTDITCYANIVSCTPAQEGFDIGCQFNRIREGDRDALVKHVLQVQASQIRERKDKNLD